MDIVLFFSFSFSVVLKDWWESKKKKKMICIAMLQ